MLNNRTVAVVVPAYNEEKQIINVVENVPEFVDRIIVVNDFSKDTTSSRVSEFIRQKRPTWPKIKIERGRPRPTRYNRADIALYEMKEDDLKRYPPSVVTNEHPETDKVILINNLTNAGVGAAIARGYKWCFDHGIDCTAVMAGDDQMDPAELESICRPIVENQTDYVKGNRLIHRSAWLIIPKTRFIGNSILSILTKIASGYWHVSDTQTGYTAISLKALEAIRIYNIYKRYGMPNDMLVKLNVAFCTLKEERSNQCIQSAKSLK